MKVATPKKVASITEKVWQRVYGSDRSSSSHYQHHQIIRRCCYESEDEYEDDDGSGTIQLMQIGAERTKNVLILMSDTGGGHRASAEAIRDAFKIEFGDEYRVILLFLSCFCLLICLLYLFHVFFFFF